MTRWQSLQTWFSSRTVRERAGVATAAAAAALALSASWFDTTLRARADAIEAKAVLARAEANAARDADIRTQRVVSEEVNKVWRWSLVDSSEGLIRAQALGLFERLVAQAGLVNSEIDLENVEPAQGAVGTLRARVSADFDWSSFNTFLAVLADLEESVEVEQLAVSARGEAGQVLEMTLAAPFVVEANP